MIRLATPLAAAALTLLVAAPALAADYSDYFDSGAALRSGFTSDWDNSDQGDPLGMELGIRYWYSWGAQSFDTGLGAALTESDRTHALEAHLRINDNSTKFYAKGLAGMSFATGDGTNAVGGGRVSYAGADLGYAWLGDFKSPFSLGPFAGYMYWNDSPNPTTAAIGSFTTATSAADIGFDPVTGRTFIPGDSTANNVEVNMLRLGVSGQARLGTIDISGEVAAVPYAKMHGSLGAISAGPLYYTDPPGAGTATTQTTPGYNVANMQSSATTVDGWGYGAMVEALVGFHPTDNLTLRVGGRAWYLQGSADATFSRATIGNPSDSDPANPPNFDTAPAFSNQGYITRNNPWSMFRYGLLAEMTYNF
jgi:hypothetical protein